MKIAQRVESLTQLAEHMNRIVEEQITFGFDIETGYEGPQREKAAVHPEEMFIVGISYALNTDEGWYVPLAHDLEDNFQIEAVADIMYPALTSGLGVAHNASFERRCMRRPTDGSTGGIGFGYDPVIKSDTMLEAFVLQRWKGVALKRLVKEIFAHDQPEFASLFGDISKTSLKKARFSDLPLTPAVIQYAVEDSIWCLALHNLHYDEVKDDNVFRLEMQVMDVCIEMEETGVLYDWEYMKEGARRAEAFRDKVREEVISDLKSMIGEDQLHSIEWAELNLGSSQQVGDILFNKLGLPVAMRSKKTGNPSASATALNQLASDYPVVQKMLWWKGLTKLHGTYLDKYHRAYDYAPDGRTHPSILQHAAITGRFAVADPPYQQTPKDYRYKLDSGDEFEFLFRPSIKPAPGRYFLYFDYSQVELRVIAALSREPALLEAFEAGEDVHTATASLMLGVDRDQVTKAQRDIGKTMNFALVYGLSMKMLAQRLAVDIDEAKRLYNQYFATYSAIKTWTEKQVEVGVRQGYTTSWLGRKHKIWEFEDKDRWIREKGERGCVNYPVQGGAADYMKVAMVRQRAALIDAGLLDRVRLIINVHDSLTWEVDENLDPRELVKLLDPAVSFPVPGFPPITADWAKGDDWGNLIEMEDWGDHALPSPAIKAGAGQDESLHDGDTVVVGEVEVVEPEMIREPLIPLVPEQEHTEAPVASESKRLVYSVDEMPTEQAWRDVVRVIKNHPGRCPVQVVTPEGSFELDYGVSDGFPVAEMVQMTWEIEEEDLDLLVDSLSL